MVRRVRVLVLAVALLPGPASATHVFHVEHMNTSQIAALDRQKTAVLLWGGILEEHGPYLPCFTDGYINEYLMRKLAEAIAARPGWAVLVFPPVPLGTTTADSLGGRRQFPGSYGVREATLRDGCQHASRGDPPRLSRRPHPVGSWSVRSNPQVLTQF